MGTTAAVSGGPHGRWQARRGPHRDGKGSLPPLEERPTLLEERLPGLLGVLRALQDTASVGCHHHRGLQGAVQRCPHNSLTDPLHQRRGWGGPAIEVPPRLLPPLLGGDKNFKK